MSLFEDASLIVTPNAYKAGKLYSIKPTNGDGDLTVVRATTATRVNSAGLIETVANNVPRLDYTNGSCPSILVEPQRTNLVLNSEFNGAISGTPGTSPTSFVNIQNTGQITVLSNPIGNKLQFTTNGTNARAMQQSVSILANTTYVYSLKADILIQNRLDMYINVGLPVGATAQFRYNGTNVANTFQVPVGACNLEILITNIINIGSLIIRLGSGILGNTNGNIIIKEPQLEVGSNPTSYIPTVASAVTRNADVISKTGISDLIGQTEGTLFFDGIVNNIQNASSNIFNTNKNPSVASQIALTKIKSTNKFRFEQFLGNGSFSNIPLNSTNSFIDGTRTKVAVRYKSGNFAMYVNGNLEATSSSTFTNIGTKSELFLNDLTTFYAHRENVSFNSVILFKEVLTNNELATLTTL